MNGHLAAEPIEELARLKELAPQWLDLWRRIPGATPFQSPAWLLAWYESFRPGPLRCVVVHRSQRLVALAPFYLEIGAHRRLLPLGISLSDYLDVLVDPECEGGVGPLLLAHLLASGCEDTLCCEELHPNASALRLWSVSKWCTALQRQSACPVLALDRLSLRGQVPKGILRRLQLARNRVRRRQACVVAAASAQTAGSLLQELFRLHTARWMSRDQSGVLANHLVRRFHETALPALVGCGLPRLYGLCIGSRIIGAYYGMQYRDRAYAYLTGFDPAFAYEGPGTVLMGHAIEQAAAQGVREFHFLRGREPYKYEWGARDFWNARLELRRRP
jgi:CelD/BcsL family acetyltransferase involved in cellulose biosynthesis